MRGERLPASEAGFTLIEVLVAMLVLAVGLLGLEALGIGAARSIALADRRSELTAVAASTVEQKQRELRIAPLAVPTGTSCQVEASTGTRVCTEVQTRSTLGTVPTRTARVIVRVSRDGFSADTFSVTSHVFDPRLP